MRRCDFIKENGKRCKARALNGFKCCWFHAPEIASERRTARINGGRNSRVFKDDARGDIILKTRDLKDLVGVGELTINQVFSGQMHPTRANCIAYLLNTLRSCIESGDIEQRVKKLEEEVSYARH